MKQLSVSAVAVTHNGSQISKLLVAKVVPNRTHNFRNISLSHIREFLENRISRYPVEKYRERLFFDTIYLQDLIDTTVEIVEAETS